METAIDTRQKFIEAALRLFADKGFYGASMDQIAGELDMTKQALIHHFGTKEKLYRAVLAQISERLLKQVNNQQADSGASGKNAFADAIQRLFEHTLTYADDTQLLMRELLDNKRRAAQAEVWYLRPFLEELRRLLMQTPAWAQADEAQAAAQVYNLLGAINYFAVSTTTLEQMYSARHVAALRAEFPQRLHRLAQTPPD
ncbi:MAG: hypothetical protein CMN28_16430 [Salinisphaeraceae bacterium]|nr:hypothetical protein [Salinisphaeraceae bacterium]